MLDKLNDDCQLLIINYLELIDQIALWEAANKTSRRLKDNVIYTWEHQPSENLVLDKNLLKRLYGNQELMSVYLKSISPKLQELELECVTVNNLKLWEQHSFPSMRVLNYTVKHTDYGQDVLDLFIKLFPNLKSVKPYGVIYFKSLSKWSQLRKLDLSQCWADDLYFIDLWMLEELILTDDLLEDPSIKDLIHFPELKTVSVLDGMYEYYSSWKCSADLLLHLKLLFETSFFQIPGLNGRVKYLQNILHNFPVQQLDLINYQFWSTEKELWKLIDSCRSLKIIYISGMKICADFFEPNRVYMEEALNKRSTPLTLHCHNTGHNEQLISQYFKHPKLTLSFEPREQQFILGHMEVRVLTS